MNIDKTLDQLYNLSVFGIKLGLNNIKEIMEKLGNPQDTYKIIHIAGTNGKGSSASMVESALLEAGYKVGKYTSPHILRFNERIVVDKKEISNEEIVELFEEVKKILGDIKATFFEVTTAMMFLHFKKQKVDYAVVEVGLGGRYDATNIVNPVSTIITSISLDHINILGDNLYQIATEKAGIIKKGIDVFVSDTNEDVKKAVLEKEGNVIFSKEKFDYKIEVLEEELVTRVEVDGDIFDLSLFGYFQGENFLNVYALLKSLGIKNEIIKRAMKKVKWPGRFEIVEKEPLLILDGAHNEDSALKLYENMSKIAHRDDVTMIVSILEDKDIKKIVEIFGKIGNKLIFTSLEGSHRGLSGKKLYEIGGKKEGVEVVEDLREAYEIGRKSKVLVVAGSFYLLAKFKEVMGFE